MRGGGGLEVEATPVHAAFAFQSLEHHLAGLDAPLPTFDDAHTALFVTWKVASRARLRGCIGTLEPRKIHQALHAYALTSALNDSRFNPISLKELPSLQVRRGGGAPMRHVTCRRWQP